MHFRLGAVGEPAVAYASAKVNFLGVFALSLSDYLRQSRRGPGYVSPSLRTSFIVVECLDHVSLDLLSDYPSLRLKGYIACIIS